MTGFRATVCASTGGNQHNCAPIDGSGVNKDTRRKAKARALKAKSKDFLYQGHKTIEV